MGAGSRSADQRRMGRLGRGRWRRRRGRRSGRGGWPRGRAATGRRRRAAGSAPARMTRRWPSGRASSSSVVVRSRWRRRGRAERRMNRSRPPGRGRRGRSSETSGLTTATRSNGCSRLRRRIMVRSISRSSVSLWRKVTSRIPAATVTAKHDGEEPAQDPALAVVAAAGPAVEAAGDQRPRRRAGRAPGAGPGPSPSRPGRGPGRRRRRGGWR